MSANTQSHVDRVDDVPRLKIRSGTLHGPLHYLSVADRRNGNRLQEELAGISIPVQAEKFISVDNYLEVLSRLDHFTGNEEIMLQTGVSQDLTEMGLVGKAVVHAENLWRALQATMIGIKYLQTSSKFDTLIRYGRCRITYHHSFGKGPSQALDTQYTIGILFNILSECPGASTGNVRMCYPDAQPEHERLFGDAVRISGGEYGMIEFDDHFLRRPLRRSSPGLSEIVFDFMEASLNQSNSESQLSEMVAALQSLSLDHLHRPLNQVEVSALLDMPVRTLQHNLTSEGCRFDHLRDSSRHQVARKALLKGREIAEIAHDIGFVHRQSFSEAFSKWEGCSPSEFRSRARAFVQ